MGKKVEIVLLDTEEDYRKEYVNLFLSGSKYFLWNVPVVFDYKSFEHIFFEPDGDGHKKGKFSKRRAKKMYFIKAILNGDVAIEVGFQQDRGTFGVFCVDLDCVIYLRNRVGTGKMQVSTFFDFGENHTKMYSRQKRKCEIVTQEEFKTRIQ